MEEKECKVKVLVCDDSKLARKKLKDILDPIGCEVCEAANGADAVVAYQQEQPDIVFMDIVMPESDGLQALEKIRNINTSAKVVMVTSTGTSTKLIEALKLGAADFIQKPFTPEQITKVINQSVAR